MKNEILDTIIFLIKGCKAKDEFVWIEDESGTSCGEHNFRYLLGQFIRNYHVDITHYYMSKAAILKWKELSDEPTFNYWYTQTVKVKNGPVTLGKYIGNSKKPIIDENCYSFKLREVFHDEHMVTINNIIDELLELDNPNYNNVHEILNKIYICRILKEEDRNIKSKSNRSTNIEEVIKQDYEPANIELVKVKGWKDKFEEVN